MDDLISRQDFDKFLKGAEEEAIKKRKYVLASALNTIRGNLRDFPSAQPEPLTDKEQRIFLAAMRREESVCKEDTLMWICKEIRRKVKGALWDEK